MKRRFWVMIFFGVLIAAPLLATGSDDLIWVNITNPSLAVGRATNYSGDHIDVMDLATRKLAFRVTGIPNPTDRAFSPDGKKVYISSVTTEHNVYVVDTRNGKILNKILLSGRPNRPSISKDGKRLYVAIRDPGPAIAIADTKESDLDYNFDNKYQWAKHGGAVDFVDTATLKVVKTVPTSGPLHNCYVTPDQKFVACDSPEAHNVAVVDIRAQRLAWEAPVEGPPSNSKVFRHGDPQSMSVEPGPDGSTNRLTIEIRGLRGFAVVDFKAHKQVKIVQFPDQPNGFISNADEPHTHGDRLTPDGKERWVASQDSNAYFVYSVPDDNLLGYVSMPEFKASEYPEFTAAGHKNPAIGCNTGDFDFTKDGAQIWAQCIPGFGIPPFLFGVDVKTMKLLDDRIPLEEQGRAGDPRALSVIQKK
jgi:DNA-binding beta-propeller fold protein YncE